jgi:hypothetical protein
MPTVIEWHLFKDKHPPVNGTPVYVCFAEEVHGSHVHVGKWGTSATGKPIGRIGHLMAFDFPDPVYWSEIILPWDHGYQKPPLTTPSAM